MFVNIQLRTSFPYFCKFLSSLLNIMECSELYKMNVCAILILVSAFLNTSSSNCFNNCDCPQDGGKVRLHCNGRNLTYFPLATALPGNVTIINYQGNKIRRLPKQPQGFKRRNVWSINLAGNIIDSLLQDNLGNTFPNLLYLYLSNNKISSLSRNSFQYLINMRGLFLSSNKLKTISQGWFSHLLHLFHLNLRNNEITVIEGITEIWPKRLSTLDLSYNKLKIIPPLPQLASKVNLIENPIFCGCYLNVNKDSRGISIEVDCHRLEYGENESIHVVYSETKFGKYEVSDKKCQQPEVVNFTYSVGKGQVVLTCTTSYGYPEPYVAVSYRGLEIEKSRNKVVLKVTKSGMYTCKITNYISSDQRQLFIPELPSLSTLPHEWTKSHLNLSSLATEVNITETASRSLDTTRKEPDRGEFVGMY